MVQNQEPHLGELPPPNLRVQPHIRKHETETRRFLPTGATFPSAASQNVRAGKKKRKRKGGGGNSAGRRSRAKLQR